MSDPTTKLLAGYINALADLAQPKTSILLLHDQARLDAYQTALAGALQELPGDLTIEHQRIIRNEGSQEEMKDL